jgi:hypothetical protein
LGAMPHAPRVRCALRGPRGSGLGLSSQAPPLIERAPNNSKATTKTITMITQPTTPMTSSRRRRSSIVRLEVRESERESNEIPGQAWLVLELVEPLVQSLLWFPLACACAEDVKKRALPAKKWMKAVTKNLLKFVSYLR